MKESPHEGISADDIEGDIDRTPGGVAQRLLEVRLVAVDDLISTKLFEKVGLGW